MADRPILFSGPMVCALLAGTKTQTRRVIKPAPFVDRMGNFCAPDRKGKVWNWGQEIDGRPCTRNYQTEHVKTRTVDRLYVREAWAPLDALTHNDPGAQALADRGFYRADNGTVDGEISRWRPGIHMPRWASRLTLIVTTVRVERLQDISEADAIAEGVEQERDGWKQYGSAAPHFAGCVWATATDAYHDLWDTLNAERDFGWDENPWVTATTFEVIKQNIDQIELPEVSAL